MQFQQSMVEAACIGRMQVVETEVEVESAFAAHQRVLNGVAFQLCSLLFKSQQSQFLHLIFIIIPYLV